MHITKELVVTFLWIVLLLGLLVQVLHYLLVYLKMALYKAKDDHGSTQPVSVIVCAKNELKNLSNNLHLLLEQAYTEFEVVVVNDCSWDETEGFLKEMSLKYNHLKVVTLKEQERYRHGKKFALTLGIKAAKNELLLLTDADCVPASRNWLINMQYQFSNQTEIVLGYGAYRKEKGLLNKLIRFDAFIVAMQYLSRALMHNAYMGVGRNLAYRKSLFFTTKGFAKHNHVVSGDDDLFVNENATPSNTTIEIQPDSFTYSEPKKTFGEWYVQKLRHTSAGKYYKAKHKLMLFAEPFFVFLFYGSLVALLVLGFSAKMLAAAYGVKLLVQFPVLFASASKLREKDVVWLFPFFELILLFLNSSFTIANLFRKQKLWK
jgi:cellulose synthase/poly-beta-1,6-N-acetylglucosamine synthase-like glycosyltransferase